LNCGDSRKGRKHEAVDYFEASTRDDLPEDLPEGIILWQISASGFNGLQRGLKTQTALKPLFYSDFMRFAGD
jgi:hypothetical protein